MRLYQKVEFESSHSLPESVKRLKRVVSDKAEERFVDNTLLHGLVLPDWVELWVPREPLFLPLFPTFHGTFSDVDGTVRLTGRFGPEAIVLVAPLAMIAFFWFLAFVNILVLGGPLSENIFGALFASAFFATVPALAFYFQHRFKGDLERMRCDIEWALGK
jgi:hypothetical protein